jgi:hypothetical protein
MKEDPDEQMMNGPEVYQGMHQLASQSWTVDTLKQVYNTKI